MHSLGLFLAFATAVGGAAAIVAGTVAARHPAFDVEDYLYSLDGDARIIDEYERKLAEPFLLRVVRPMSNRLAGLIHRFTPADYLETTHKKLLHAGLSSSIRAEEFVVAQVGCFALTSVTGLGWAVL